MIRRGSCALAALALLLGACSAPPAPAPAPRAADDMRLAAEAMEVGDYGRAADLYRLEVAKSPDSVAAHYGLAVAASHLDLRPEAIREFRWVLERGEAGTTEVANARKWLVKVGALPPATARPSAPAESESEANSPASEVGSSVSASVEGRAVSADADQRPLKRLQIFLIEQPSRVHHYRMRTDEDGRFRFANVAPGIYKLSDRISGPPMWRLRVEAKPGQVVLLDLGAGNTAKVRDDFPNHQ